jgi:peptide/nickel transport system permease protein
MIQSSAVRLDTIAAPRRTVRSSLFSFSRRNLISTAGAVVVVALVLVAIFADVIAPYQAGEQIAPRLESPGGEYLFGTDNFGRDVFSRVIHGTRVSLQVGLICVPIGLLIGAGLGLLAGVLGGMTDLVIMRCMDILFAFPSLVLAILIAAVLGSSLTNAMIAIGIIIIPIYARTARGPVLSVMEKEFIEAARVVGVRKGSLVLRHVLPNIMTPLVVQATISFSAAMLDEAALSFLGLGAQPPTPSWGAMLGDARNFSEIAPWMAIFPGVAFVIAVLSLNLLGDGLRDYLDPRTRNRL